MTSAAEAANERAVGLATVRKEEEEEEVTLTAILLRGYLQSAVPLTPALPFRKGVPKIINPRILLYQG